MLNNIFFKTLYDMRQSLITWGLIFLLLNVMMMAFWPSIENSQADYQDMLDSFPDAIMGMFGGEIDLSTIEGYLAVEMFSIFLPIMILAVSVMYGAGLLAKEEEEGTLDVLLSTPTPRWRVFLDKFLALVVYVLVMLIATFLGLFLGAFMVGSLDELHLGRLLAGILQLGLLGLFFGGLTFALTGTQRARGMALGATLGLAALSYLIFVMADTVNLPDVLMWLSPWYYYDGVAVLREGLTIGHTALLAGVTVLMVGGGMFAFERRDVGT